MFASRLLQQVQAAAQPEQIVGAAKLFLIEPVQVLQRFKGNVPGALRIIVLQLPNGLLQPDRIR
ncbi:hypothetical protein [Paenibacillus thiaminolyticus]|uniref:hypothetical protein n=1 Tax=Paenibacillus thiaminolyticus TaxID=49283 RepID=UPI001F1059B0|nr:hypothetical protein [Paenibacillus thiaminolyticus]